MNLKLINKDGSELFGIIDSSGKWIIEPCSSFDDSNGNNVLDDSLNAEKIKVFGDYLIYFAQHYAINISNHDELELGPYLFSDDKIIYKTFSPEEGKNVICTLDINTNENSTILKAGY